MKKKLMIVLFGGILALLAAQPAFGATFEIEHSGGFLRTPGGEPLHDAGAHADFNTTVAFNKVLEPETGLEGTVGDPKDVVVTLPPGLVGNPTATPKCTQADMLVLKWYANCDPETQVGVATVNVGYQQTVPVYNLVPPKGVAGQFAFNILSTVIFFDATVTASGGYQLKVDVSNASQGLRVSETSVTFWGVPASPSHDLERVRKGGFSPGEGSFPSTAAQLPMMSNPTSCSGEPLRTDIKAASWQEPGNWSYSSFDTEEGGAPLTIGACDQVPFEASMEVQPTTSQASSPSGLEVDVRIPQNRLPEGLTASHLRDAVVQLPAGMTLNPAAAGGLGSCSEGQIGLDLDSTPTCPDDSKIGTVKVVTPLLEAPLEGSVYLARQGQNKFGSLLALYLVVDDPATGVLIKIPGKVEAAAADGRLVARFEDTPQLPFEELTMSLDGGPRAPLMTPAACGTYSSRGEFTPWSGTATVASTDSFRINSGPNGSACPDGGFAPGLEAGVADPTAGRYSPIELVVSREDGSEGLDSIAAKLPKGLLAKLAGVPYCPESALAGISTAEGTGAAQLASPSCPAASRVGSVAVAAGAGSSPLWVKTGSAYLAGPYKGAPLSLAIVTPALAGPFDLGNVVVRSALRVDPTTAQVTAESDPLPTILHGIPLDLREVRVTLDRPSFTVNPTSCSSQSVAGSITSTGGKRATPSARFAAAGCAGLGFGPKLALALKGATKRTGNPAVSATLTAPSGQANLADATVILPRSEFIDNSHIGNPCTRVQFAAEACPEKSILGRATAWSPLLGEPLTGLVYFRSNGGERKLPDIVADLHGQIHLVVVGFIDSVKVGKDGSRVRTRFLGLPDAPVSKFKLDLKGGKRGLLENSLDLCSSKPRAKVTLIGQNGGLRSFDQKVGTSCGKQEGARK